MTRMTRRRPATPDANRIPALETSGRSCLRRAALAALFIMAAAYPACPHTPAADDLQRWQSLNQRVVEAYRSGNYADGTGIAREALELARRRFGDRAPETLTSLNNLAGLYQAQGRYAEAEPLSQEALQARRETLGSRHPDTLTSLNTLASLYRAQGRYLEAELLYQEALQERREVLGPRHPETLTSLNNLAALYKDQGRYEKAEPLLREAAQGSRDALGGRHPQTLTSLSNLASLYMAQGRHGDAEPLFQDVLQARREVLPPRHPAIISSLNNLAFLYYAEGRYRDAEPLFREALRAWREVAGDRHPNTISGLNNLALTYGVQGRYDEAEPLLLEAVRTARDVFGPRHPTTLSTLNSLGDLYQSQGRYGQAEPLYREALEGRHTTLGPQHPDTLTGLNNLADLYQQQGRYGEAEPLLREALQGRRETLGPRHHDTVITLNNLAGLYENQRRYSEAELLYREALQTMRETLGPRHPDTLISLNNLAGVCNSLGRTGEADALYQEALEGRRETLGPRHPMTLTSLNNLAAFYQDHGSYAEAEPLFREASEGRRDVLGPHHPDTLVSQLNLVVVLVNRDQREAASRELQKMETNLLDWIGQEVHSTEAGAVRRRLLSSQATFQDVALSLATTGGSPDDRRLASTVMLRFKGLQGEEEAYLARLTRRSGDPHVRTLTDQLGILRTGLAAAARGAPDAFGKTLQALEAKQQELVDASPEYRTRLRVQTASLDEVRAALPASAVLIEFRLFRPVDFPTGKVGEPRFAGLLLSGSDEPIVVDLGPVSELQQLATALDDQAATKLYQRLTAPFEQKLAAAQTVYVAPDGILNLVPFARLKLPDGRYWWERQEVHMLQTGRDLLRPNPDNPARGLLALGGIDFGTAPADTGQPDSIFFASTGSDRSAAITRAAATFRSGFAQLPATVDEVKDITEWYQLLRADEPAEVWSGSAASKTRLMTLNVPPRVLHLATHGFYRPNESREPMLLSGIALAGANRELAGTGTDGLLFALEAEGLNLDGTELVVLSACDTAQGNLDYSEGVFGLARALRTAGARNVLVTLWKLKDGEAHDFMADFYKNWLTQDRSDPAKALRDTQLSWMKQDNRRDPSAWAPYVLIE
jgi:tetratricopeptide (TPR) repeat protein